ncbi:MAG: hypothetical protein OEV42_02460 [Deltaproteobacteria bacterium]|nr:hypothetical protein [Deltaproteobacteria bacterium]
MSNQCCSKCVKNFYEGSLKYIVRIKVLADFDGHTGSDDEAGADDLESLIRQIEKSAPETLENDIHQEMVFLLCKNCRNTFVKNPLNFSRESGEKKESFSGLLH